MPFNPVGRWHLRRGVMYRAYPVLRPAATWWRQSGAHATRVVTVVGSYGKTTTAHCVAAAIGAGREMNLASNQFGFLAAKVLSLRRGQRRAVIEVGIDGPGQMRPYAEMVRPDVTVVTSIGSEHGLSLASLEATAEEKAEMVAVVPPSGAAVLNGDDVLVSGMADRCRGRIVTYGFESGRDVRVVGHETTWPSGSNLEVSADGKRLWVRSRLIGRHMALPMAAALAVAHVEGLDLEEVASRLEAVPPVAGRMQPVRLSSGAWCLRDDYKSGLETVERALDVLEELAARPKALVLGDVTEPPERQGPMYRRLGARIAEIADQAFFVGNRATTMAAGARRAKMPEGAFHVCGTRVRDAIHVLERELDSDGVVLVKGRDTQRLERIVLALEGRGVRCNLKICRATNLPCEACRMLEPGWPGERD